MSFQKSSENIEYTHCHLHATCKCNDGTENESKITLDDFIGNDNGVLVWGGENFSQTSKEIYLIKDVQKYGPILKCNAKKTNGVWTQASLDLNERIANNDGVLTFK